MKKLIILIGLLFLSPNLMAGFIQSSHIPASSIVKIHVFSGKYYANGSGVVIGNGRIVTAYHVIEDADHIEIEFDGHMSAARVISEIRGEDLALLSASTGRTPYVPLVPEDWIASQQEEVSLVGYPFGGNQKLHVGNVSSYIETNYDRLYFDSPVMQGESGGGIFITIDNQVYLAGIITDSTSPGHGHGITGGAGASAAFLRHLINNQLVVATR